MEGEADGDRLRVTDGLCDTDSEEESEAASDNDDVGERDTDAESEIVALELAAGEGVIVGVELADSEASGGICDKFTDVEAIGDGFAASSLKNESDPTAYTTVVGPVRLICASPASPLSALRVHVMTVVLPDCVHVNPDVPAVE